MNSEKGPAGMSGEGEEHFDVTGEVMTVFKKDSRILIEAPEGDYYVVEYPEGQFRNAANADEARVKGATAGNRESVALTTTRNVQAVKIENATIEWLTT